MNYPFPSGAPDLARSFLDRLRTDYDTFRVTRRERRNRADVTIQPVREVKSLTSADVPLIFVTHNDVVLLNAFIQHYRQLGVTRFICVDDVSTDGTREALLNEPDVDVWTSPVRYGQARRGRNWREGLFSKYGLDRWYVNVDSDEFLVYDDCFNQPLPALIRMLEAQNLKRMAAPMLDMYPKLREVGAKSTSIDKPWQFSCYFDGDSYVSTLKKRGVSVRGGPRGRKFGEGNELIKYPLIFWDRTCLFGSSLHQPLPYGRNFPSVWGVILHFKFFTNYKTKITEAAEGKQHYNSSEHYQKMMDVLHREGEIDFSYDQSIRYEGPQQLIDYGFMTKIDFPQGR
ncbi:glycosyltransferase family 2 protein [Rhizobium sp. BK068]|uniref:glycosyltransferase family 2 protein n=1 Tax=Rhizobium sp. BK068 TaxID=2512130 RepID=UPI00104F6AE0|nr:glycosyltransferase family 2 protein [Rhizobium sp. BK068]TCM71991.1 glycosyl transferase family 2 [Rhizobium sp. BK068]